jgi:GTPase SAR1 family protein
MNHFIRSTKISDRQVELVIWDNTGREGYETMRRLSYEDAHIVLICFDISDPDSFENIDYMVRPNIDQRYTVWKLMTAVEC